MTILQASGLPAFQDGDGPATQRNFYLPNSGVGPGATGPTGLGFLPENVPLNFPIQDQAIITGFSARLGTELLNGESARVDLLVNDGQVAGTVFLGPQPPGGVTQNFDFPPNGYVLVAAGSRFDVKVELRRLGFTGPGKAVLLSVTTKLPTP